MAEQTWTPIKEAIEDLWIAFLTPPQGHLRSFIALLMDKDDRFPQDFLENFINMLNTVRGCHSIDNLSEPLKKIIKKVGWNGAVWNPNDDPEYLIPRSLMLKLFHHVRDKIKQREREQGQKEKEALMKHKIEEANQILITLERAIEDLWTSFLTPPQGHLRSFIAFLMDEDDRFPQEFLHDFLDIYNHLCGLNTTGMPDYMDIFEGVAWNPTDDPEYEIPKSMMHALFEQQRDKLMGNDEEGLEIEEIVTSEQIEKNKENKRKLMEDSSKQYVEGKKAAYREGKLGRDVVRFEAKAKMAANLYKNTLKRK